MNFEHRHLRHWHRQLLIVTYDRPDICVASKIHIPPCLTDMSISIVYISSEVQQRSTAVLERLQSLFSLALIGVAAFWRLSRPEAGTSVSSIVLFVKMVFNCCQSLTNITVSVLKFDELVKHWPTWQIFCHNVLP